jgi:nitrate reductase gamma subunit
MTPLQIVPYVAVATFVVGVVVRWVKIKRMPVHLRWEIYPVAHEANARHGGSFFEHVDWWNRRSEKTRVGELKVMLPEILFLNGVRAHSRSLWFRSYPFHLGLYLLATFLGLLVGGAILQTVGIAGADGWLAAATIGAGMAGLLLLGAGALGLLARRLADPVLREHSSAADFANLLWFLGMAVLGLVTLAAVDPGFSSLRRFMLAVVTFQPAADVPLLVALEIVGGSALLAYIPLTHMSHFFTKWFMYHDVRWDDEVNRAGSSLEAAIARQLDAKVKWAAPHIRGDGKKTWAEVATEEVSKP